MVLDDNESQSLRLLRDRILDRDKNVRVVNLLRESDSVIQFLISKNTIISYSIVKGETNIKQLSQSDEIILLNLLRDTGKRNKSTVINYMFELLQ